MQENSIIINVNPKLYPLEAVYSASYVFLDKAYIQLDGDPEKEILVKLTLKQDGDINQIKGEFLNELINYADYLKRAEKTKGIREILLQRILLTSETPPVEEDKDDEEIEKVMKELEEEGALDDIEIPQKEEDKTK
jgi:His-Xaa-Ser system protein HxsD